MNRRDRRRLQRAARAGNAVAAALVGLRDACADCGADGSIAVTAGGRMIAHIWHDDGCPAGRGVTAWRPGGTALDVKR